MFFHDVSSIKISIYKKKKEFKWIVYEFKSFVLSYEHCSRISRYTKIKQYEYTLSRLFSLFTTQIYY